MKQETLEEFALRNSKYTNHSNINNQKQEAIILGAKWQQERLYSEEEVIKILNRREDYLGTNPSIFDYQDNIEWFEQFKKK